MSSPKVTIREEVFANPLLPSTGFTTVVVGMASKGDVGVFKTTGSSELYANYWGDPVSSSLMYFTAQKYLQYSSNLILARVTDGTDEKASKSVSSILESGVENAIDLIGITALSSGTWGNDISVKFTRTSVANNLYLVQVYFKGNMVEQYTGCSILPGSSNFIETKIVGKSSYIDVEVNYESVNRDEITLTNTTVTLSGGTNGDADASIISTNIATLLQKLTDKDRYTFDLVIVPDMSYDADVSAALVSLVASRNDCQTIIDMPQDVGLSNDPVGNAVKWTNGAYQSYETLPIEDQQNIYGTSKLDNKNVFAFAYWQKEYDTTSQAYIWAPPSIYVAQKFAYLEANKFRWLSVAGMMDGRLTTVDVQYSPSQAERDLLYGDQLDGAINVVNPIVNFPAEGIVIWGQRTTERSENPTNRINVAVMLNYVKQNLYRIGKQLQFKVNDSDLWLEYETKVGSVLNYVLQNKGCFSYNIIKGSVSNTPEIIANNKFLGKITIVPSAIAEEIEFVVEVTPQGVIVT